jgi:hypothetical protein
VRRGLGYWEDGADGEVGLFGGRAGRDWGKGEKGGGVSEKTGLFGSRITINLFKQKHPPPRCNVRIGEGSSFEIKKNLS